MPTNGNGNNGSGSSDDWNFGDWWGNIDWGSATDAAGTLALWNKMRDDLSKFGESARTGAREVGEEAADWSRFLPFTVTSGAGTAHADYSGTGEATYYTQADVDAGTLPAGKSIGDVKTEAFTPGLNLSLSDDQQAFSDWYTNLTSGMMTDYMGEYGEDWRETKEQSVYDRIMAAMEPGRERDRLALESRLLGQGRTGVRTDMFGGTPEQLALAKAQEEQAQQAMIAAMTRASTEQQEDFGNIGRALGMQYAPEQFLLSTLAPGTNIASIADLGRRQGAGYIAETGMAGIDAALQAMLGKGNLTGEVLQSLLSPRGESGGGLLGSFFTGGEEGGGLFDLFGGIWSKIFGGDDD